MALPGILALALLLIVTGRWLTSNLIRVLIFGGFPVLMVAMAGRLDVQAITWFKIFSLCSAILVIHLAPLLREKGRRIAAVAIYVLLALNIAGPAVYDLVAGHWFGGAVALAIILLIPRWNALTYPVVEGRAVVAYDIPWLWIGAYTVWDMSFVVSAYPSHASDHIAVLSAPLILSLWVKDRPAWLRFRAFTISLYGVMVVAAIDLAQAGWIPAIGLERIHDPLVAAAWALVAGDILVRLRNRHPERVPGSVAAAG
jgi:hypothetical protein